MCIYLVADLSYSGIVSGQIVGVYVCRIVWTSLRYLYCFTVEMHHEISISGLFADMATNSVCKLTDALGVFAHSNVSLFLHVLNLYKYSLSF